MVAEGTSLNDTVTPEILFHWAGVTLCIEKVVLLTQCGNLGAGITIVNGHDISNTKYVDSMCAKGQHNLIVKTPEA